MYNSDKNSSFVNKMVNSLKEVPLLHFMTKAKLKKVDKIHYKKVENDEALECDVDEIVIQELEFGEDLEIEDTCEETLPVLGPRILNFSNDVDSIVDKIKERDKKGEKEKTIKEIIESSRQAQSKVLMDKQREKYRRYMIEKELKALKACEYKKEVVKMASRFYKAALQATNSDLQMAKTLLLKKKNVLKPGDRNFSISLEAINAAIYKLDYEIAKKHGEFSSSQSVYEKKVVKF